MKILFSILIFPVFLEIILRITGFGYTYVQTMQNKVSVTSKTDEQIILCIGESTTAWGLGESYPAQLQLKLNQYYGEGHFRVVNLGVAGTDTQKIAANLQAELENYDPKIVVTMMGINDSWQIRGEEGFYQDLKIYKLLKIIQHNLRALQEPEIATRPEPQDLPPIENIGSEETRLLAAGEAEDKLKNFVKANRIYHDALKNGFNSGELMFRIGQKYLATGKTTQAEEYFQKFVENSKTEHRYARVAEYYFFEMGSSNKYGQKKAREYIHKAYKINPDSLAVLRLLGLSFAVDPATHSLAIPYLEKAVSHGSLNGDVIDNLGRIYFENKEYEKADKIFKLGLGNQTDMGFFIWRDFLFSLQAQGKFDEAKKYIDLALERFPNNQNLMDINNIIGTKVGKANVKEDMDHSVTYWLKNFLLFPKTRQNQIRVAELIEKHESLHVVMQYPMREITELQNILSSFKKIIYVENKLSFEKELKTKSYADLFNDRFAGDFGHFTLLGSQLVADQLIKTLQENKILPASNHF